MSTPNLQINSPALNPLSHWAVELHGTHGLSSGFEYQLHVITAQPLVLATLIGTPIDIQLCYQQPKTVINGIIVAVQQQHHHDTQHYQYIITLSSTLQTLQHQVKARQFTNLSAVNIIKQILLPTANFKINFSRLQKAHSPIDYVVQYQESTYHFIQRLCAEQGLYFYFTHHLGYHQCHFADANTTYGPHASYPLGGQHQLHFMTWHQHWRVIPTQLKLINTNNQQPHRPLTQQIKQPDVKSPLVIEYVHFPAAFNSPATGQNRAKQQLHENQNSRHHLKIDCNILHLSPNMTIQRQQDNTTFVITQSILHIKDTQHHPFTQREPELILHNALEAISSQQCFITPLPKYKPHINQCMTATVLTQTGSTLQYNPQGQIKIKPHWLENDDETLAHTISVPLSQPLAGNQFGFNFIPRKNDEVLVKYFNGEPNRPIIIGSVYNANNTPAVSSDKIAHTSGYFLKTPGTVKELKSNRVVFDDKPKQEKVTVQAKHDYIEQIAQSLNMNIGNNASYITGKNYLTHIEKGQQSIEAKQAIRLQSGKSYIEITPDKITIQGTKVNFN